MRLTGIEDIVSSPLWRCQTVISGGKGVSLTVRKMNLAVVKIKANLSISNWDERYTNPNIYERVDHAAVFLAWHKLSIALLCLSESSYSIFRKSYPSDI